MMKIKKFSMFVVLSLSIMQSSVSNATILTITDEGSWQTTSGTWSTVDFEGFLGAVNNQYVGVTFSDFNGGAPYATNVFSHEGVNSMFTVVPWNAGGGGWAVDFDTSIQSFAFWAGDVQFSGSTISIFDFANDLLGSYDLMGFGGGHGPSLYGFNGFLSDALDISRVELAINSADAVWFDNFQYSPSQTPVPEPTTFILFGTGIAGLLGTRLRKKKE